MELQISYYGCVKISQESLLRRKKAGILAQRILRKHSRNCLLYTSVEGADICRCPVKTAGSVPKEKMFAVMDALDGVCLHAPVHCGDVVLADVCGTGVDVVATRELPAEE